MSGEIDGTGSDSVTVWPWSTGFYDHAVSILQGIRLTQSGSILGQRNLLVVGSGLQDIKISYNLPLSLNQAVRVTFRYRGVQGASGACSSGNYDDNDDLAFTVKSNLSLVENLNQPLIVSQSEAQEHDVAADYSKRIELNANKRIRRGSKTSKQQHRQHRQLFEF